MNEATWSLKFLSGMCQRNHLYLALVFVILLFLNHSDIAETKDKFLISEIKQWTPYLIQNEFNVCRGIGLWQCGNFCSEIKHKKLAVLDCLRKSSTELSQCSDVYQLLND